MAHWTDLATWRGPTSNQGGPMLEVRGLIIHIAEGSYEGTIAWQKNPASDVSSHFVTDYDGGMAQVVDTDVTAWTQRAGNGHWLSVENAGHTPNALTAAQCEAVAKLLARAHVAYGVPLQVATNPNGRGLGHHSMGTNGGSVPTDTWTGATWGHEDCPGPAIVAQKQSIVDRAARLVAGGGDGMVQMLVRFSDDPTGQIWLCDGMTRRKVKPEWVGNGTGPITNAQVHQAALLGPLGSNGTVFVSAGDWDVWGVEHQAGGGGTVSGPVDLTDTAVAKVADATADELHSRLAG